MWFPQSHPDGQQENWEPGVPTLGKGLWLFRHHLDPWEHLWIWMNHGGFGLTASGDGVESCSLPVFHLELWLLFLSQAELICL